MTKPKLLIVEDDEGIRTQLKYALSAEFTPAVAEDGEQALKLLADVRPAAVTLDLGLPPHPNTAEEGLKALEQMLRLDHSVKVVVVTGNSDRDNALRAVQLGAFDYHLKPLDLPQLKVVLQRAVYLRGLEAESERHASALESVSRFHEILGDSPKMRDIFAIVSRVAKTDATVLIQGESGTGKELLARAIHVHSPRRGQFHPINCGAIPETLLESELFGHEKGAYTGAHVQRKGKIEAAQGGTLFLDEIGEMSLGLQVKLLRFLQEREIERVGGRERIRVDVRILAATNKDLKAEIQAGRFREDLFYRLSVVTIAVPPLRERAEDILLLATAFLRRGCQDHKRKLRFSQDAILALMEWRWPGNIRELENRIQRGIILAQGRLIQPADLDLEAPRPAPDGASLKEVRSRAEHRALVEALVAHHGNVSRAAKDLKVSRPTFHALLGKHELQARDFR